MRDCADFIHLFEGALAPRLADSIVAEYGPSDLWKPAETAGLTENYRVCSRIPISLDSIIEQKTQRKTIDTQIFNTVGEIAQSYMGFWSERLTVHQDSGYDLLRYEPGGHYEFHVDECIGYKRVISMVVGLSGAADYTGGDLEFLDGPKFHLGKGDVVVFPSSFVFPHKVHPVLEGLRYSMVTWFS